MNTPKTVPAVLEHVVAGKHAELRAHLTQVLGLNLAPEHRVRSQYLATLRKEKREMDQRLSSVGQAVPDTFGAAGVDPDTYIAYGRMIADLESGRRF